MDKNEKSLDHLSPEIASDKLESLEDIYGGGNGDLSSLSQESEIAEDDDITGMPYPW